MSKLWLTLNAEHPLPERRSRPRVSENTVPHEGQIWRELGYAPTQSDPDKWQRNPGVPVGESLNFTAGVAAAHK